MPVSTAIGSTRLNTSAAPIAPPTSTTAQVTGTVTDAGSPPQALVDASVNAQQLLSTSQALDVAWSLVDPVSASYTFRSNDNPDSTDGSSFISSTESRAPSKVVRQCSAPVVASKKRLLRPTVRALLSTIRS